MRVMRLGLYKGGSVSHYRQDVQRRSPKTPPEWRAVLQLSNAV